MNTITWNGWIFVAGKRSYWKERHNPKMKNFREKVTISAEEHNDACKKWASIFR